LQQVGADAILRTAEPVDPRKLPALLSRPARRLAVAARYAWVLNRRRVLQGAAVVVLLAGMGGAWEARDGLVAGIGHVGGAIEARFAQAGFSIRAINISGQVLTAEADVLKALGVEPGMPSLSYDADAARARVAELPAVETVSVRKIYPGRLDVAITEKAPVARWRIDGVTFLVDAAGEQIGLANGAYADLPLVVGDGAGDDAMAMIRALERYGKLTTGLAALSRIGDRRWDLIYYTGLRVQLPEMGVGQALADLSTYEERYQLIDRDVEVIDLRVPGTVAIKPGALAVKQLAELAKQKKKKKPAAAHVVDPAYETPAEKHGD
jgi:cell division protein FtsQ